MRKLFLVVAWCFFWLVRLLLLGVIFNPQVCLNYAVCFPHSKHEVISLNPLCSFWFDSSCLHNIWLELRLSIVHLFISECIIVQSLYCFCLKECHCPDYSKKVYSKAYSVSSEPGNTPQKGPWAANASNAGFWFFTSSRAVHTQKQHVSSLNLARSPISFASLVFKPAAG